MRILIIILTISLAFIAEAKEVSVSGTYSFVLPSDMSESEGRETAVRKAVLQALADEFGTVVSAEIWTDVRNDNTVSSTSLWELGSSFVKGEWIRDERPPEITKAIADSGETIITATVWGKARPVASAAIDIKAFLSTPGSGLSQSQFANKSRFTLSFKSPVGGYLSVYLCDENGDVCRLLPFAMDEESVVRVNPMEQYEFFTSQRGIEEQYMFLTYKEKARNVVYLVFSSNRYVRPLDSYYSDRNLRILTRRDFLDWLGRQKSTDNTLTVITLPVEILSK